MEERDKGTYLVFITDSIYLIFNLNMSLGDNLNN